MTNQNDFLNTLTAQFNNLNIDELAVLKEQFNVFYYEKQFNDYFKIEITNEKSTNVVCPYCGSDHVIKHGKDQFGDQRYLCKNSDCKKHTFSLKTNTLLYYSKSNKSQWLLFFECLFNKDSISTTANKVGICENTVIAWRHKTMYLIYKMLEHNKMTGLVSLDETFFDCVLKGIDKEPEIEVETKKKRGISNNKIGVACAIDEANQMILKVINRGRPTSKSLIDTFKGYINSSNKVISDSLRSYHKLQKELEYEWIKIPSGKKSYMGYTLDEINQLHGNLKMFLSCYRGVSVTFLQGYVSLFELLSRYKRYYQDKSFKSIVKAILMQPLEYRGYDFTQDFIYD